MSTDGIEATTERIVAKSIVDQTATEPVNATNKVATKKPKIKIVRDFSMPQVEYQKVSAIKEVCLKAGLRAKKSEILRAGLKVLGEMHEDQIITVIVGLVNKNDLV
jgi:hypothetical protein